MCMQVQACTGTQGICSRKAALKRLDKVSVQLCTFKGRMPQKQGNAFNAHALL
jgi:hypothetical protein